MRTHRCILLVSFLLALSTVPGVLLSAQTASQRPASSTADVILKASDLDAILPSSVFFSGQSATVQKRNSAGVRFAGGALMFATKIDTGGYSSSIQERYQDYLITEVVLTFGTNRLPPGSYGIGFLSDNKFIVMDIGGHDLFTADSHRDDALGRPTPLQVLADTAPQSYRLYSGKTFVTFSRLQKPGR